MDIKPRHVSYTKWKTDEVKVMVATTAFGMGIDKKDIRHVVWYGCQKIFAAGLKNWGGLVMMAKQQLQLLYIQLQILTMLLLGSSSTIMTRNIALEY